MKHTTNLKVWLAVDVLVTLVLVAGIWLVNNWEKQGGETAQARTPASIEKVFDFSYLESGALAFAAQKRIASSINVEKDEAKDELRLYLGNFVLANEEKSKVFACGYYDKVEVVFEAEGMAVSGEKPEWHVEADCQVGADINEMLPIKISLAKLRQEKPGDVELKLFENGSSVALKFTNMPNQAWPKQWIVKEIAYKNSSLPSRILKVNTEAVRNYSQKPVVLNW